LPHTHNDGRPVAPEKFLQTRDEPIAQFGAVSLSPYAVTGTWVYGETRYEDQSMRIVVDVKDSAENRRFFVRLQSKLRKRFEQIEIYMASMPSIFCDTLTGNKRPSG
jgi:hypothetical protein